VDGREEARKPRGTKTFHSEIEIRVSTSSQANYQKNLRQGLKLVNPAPEQFSVRFEKDVVPAPSDGADKVANPGMD